MNSEQSTKKHEEQNCSKTTHKLVVHPLEIGRHVVCKCMRDVALCTQMPRETRETTKCKTTKTFVVEAPLGGVR